MLQKTISTRTEPISQYLIAGLKAKTEQRQAHRAGRSRLGSTPLRARNKFDQTAELNTGSGLKTLRGSWVVGIGSNHRIASAGNAIVLDLRDVSHKFGTVLAYQFEL